MTPRLGRCDGAIMRILRFSHDYLLSVGGLPINLRGLNRELASRGVDIDQAFLIGDRDFPLLVSNGGLLTSGDTFVQRDARVSLFPCIVPSCHPTVPDGDSPEAMKAFEARFRRIVAERKPDLVHVHLVNHRVQLRALQIAAENYIPTVLSHHEGRPETDEADALLQAGAEIADLRFAITDYSARAIRSRRVDYIGFYIDTNFWNPAQVSQSDAARWKTYLFRERDPEHLFVYPARFIPRKNHAAIVHAAYILRKAASTSNGRLRFKIVFAGETTPQNHDYNNGIRTLIEQLQLSDYITVLDVQTREELRSLVSLADAVVYPAFNEGAGRSHLEGSLLGACPIVADDAGLTQYVEHGVSGLAFPPDDPRALAECMTTIIENRSHTNLMRKRAQATASLLSLGKYAVDHITMYEHLITDRANTNRIEMLDTIDKSLSVNVLASDGC